MCFDIQTVDPKSFKFAGSQDNGSAHSLTAYKEANYRGEVEYKLYASDEDFRFEFTSLVLIEGAVRRTPKQGSLVRAPASPHASFRDKDSSMRRHRM